MTVLPETVLPETVLPETVRFETVRFEAVSGARPDEMNEHPLSCMTMHNEEVAA